MKSSNVQLSSQKYLETVTSMFQTLHNDEQLTDVTLCCKEGKLKAHKLILATSSPYLRKILTENQRDHPILIMHGVPFVILQKLIELIYKGSVDIPSNALNPMLKLLEELEISGIHQEENTINDSSISTAKLNDTNNHGRDTRFKGLKRVAVDYKEFNENRLIERRSSSEKTSIPKKICVDNSSCATETEAPIDEQREEIELEKIDTPKNNDDVPKNESAESPKLSAWAKKQRKFKCQLCPASFKRASHLTRHQLVHTGERPFACTQCDKAFSRHDKLKHHIRKTHETSQADDPDRNYYTLPPKKIPEIQPITMISQSQSQSQEPQQLSPELEYSQSLGKRGRGRPRKYPLAPKPLVKRGRGRPRLNPVHKANNGENYDITNLPYGDLEYLTMPLRQPPPPEDNRAIMDEDSSVLIEPYVEIKTEPIEKEEVAHDLRQNQCSSSSSQAKEVLRNAALNVCAFENQIAQIGECTISVASNH